MRRLSKISTKTCVSFINRPHTVPRTTIWPKFHRKRNPTNDCISSFKVCYRSIPLPTRSIRICIPHLLHSISDCNTNFNPLIFQCISYRTVYAPVHFHHFQFNNMFTFTRPDTFSKLSLLCINWKMMAFMAVLKRIYYYEYNVWMLNFVQLLLPL